MAIGNIQLDGVIIKSNSKRAVLRMKNQVAGAPGKKGQPASPYVTVREGQMVGDYRVSKIESKSISLEKDGQTFTVGLFAENKVVTPPSRRPSSRCCSAADGCARSCAAGSRGQSASRCSASAGLQSGKPAAVTSGRDGAPSYAQCCRRPGFQKKRPAECECARNKPGPESGRRNNRGRAMNGGRISGELTTDMGV